MTNQSNALPLSGLRADNLLAYLAALGVLRTLAIHQPDKDPRLGWQLAGGAWQPVLAVSVPWSSEDLVTHLFGLLQGQDHAPQFVMATTDDAPADNLTIPGHEFRQLAQAAAESATPTQRAWADFCAAYGTEAYDLEKDIEDTALRTMSGAGHQHFLASMRKLAVRPVVASVDAPAAGRTRSRRQPSGQLGEDGTTADQLRRALFAPWDYKDPGPAMRWDPRDDRRYALRADDPSGSKFDPIRTMRGANRLAIEALPLFPVFPTADGAYTASVRRVGKAWVVCLPIWTAALRLETVSMLIQHPYLEDVPKHRAELAMMGVIEVYGSARVNAGRMVNFAPGCPWYEFENSRTAEDAP